MKQFNLEEAKNGKPVCTRSGREIRSLKIKEHSIEAVVGIQTYKRTIVYDTNGKHFSGKNSSFDLFMKEES